MNRLGIGCAALVTLAGLLSACGDDDCTEAEGQWLQDSTAPATRLSLARVCTIQGGCPIDKAAAIKRVRKDIAEMPKAACDAHVVSGCGIETVEESWATHGNAWHYDSKTKELIGADRLSDTVSKVEGCRSVEFVAGTEVPACPKATTVSLCSGSSDEDAGSEDDGGAP